MHLFIPSFLPVFPSLQKQPLLLKGSDDGSMLWYLFPLGSLFCIYLLMVVRGKLERERERERESFLKEGQKYSDWVCFFPSCFSLSIQEILQLMMQTVEGGSFSTILE
jgi:hypothetical protein